MWIYTEGESFNLDNVIDMSVINEVLVMSVVKNPDFDQLKFIPKELDIEIIYDLIKDDLKAGRNFSDYTKYLTVGYG